MGKRDLKIYVVTHKTSNLVSNNVYCPIQVNAKQNEHFLAVTDDTGDNISEKNNRFCELTALYWIWKNDIQHDYIGLCHYRRYFKFSKSFFNHFHSIFKNERLNLNDLKINGDYLIDLEKDYVIVPKKYKFGGKIHSMTVREQYIACHNEDDLNILKDVVLEKYPKCTKAWNIVLQRDWIYAYNMFVMSNKIFSEYMNWLFDILFETEKRIPPKADAYQNRTFGFMAERLFNVFLEYKKCKVKELPIIFLT